MRLKTKRQTAWERDYSDASFPVPYMLSFSSLPCSTWKSRQVSTASNGTVEWGLGMRIDHTSEGAVQCQGQNPCGIVAVLAIWVGVPQLRSSEVMKMLIKCCLIFISIL